MSSAKAVQPYLFFNGRCEEALEWYRQALGAQLDMMMRFKESPEPDSCPPGAGEKIMHASFRIGGSTLMASDGRCAGATNFDGFSLSLSVADPAEAERLFNALAEGGKVEMPLGETFWSPKFGMVEDRFGMSWMINVEP